MIPVFPQPYPDEILYSVVARYHLISGNQLARQTMDELFGLRKKTLSPAIPQNLHILSERARMSSADQLLLEHTMFPYFMAFATKKNEAVVTTWIQEGRSNSITAFLNQFPNHFVLGEIRFCPECYAEELKRYGEGYWHRLHQTPGVLVCHRHHRPLAQTTAPHLTVSNRTLMTASPAHLFPAVYPPSLSPLAIQQALQIANDVYYLYQNFQKIRARFAHDQYSFRSLYLALLYQKGLATKNGSLYLLPFREKFLDFFATDLLWALKLGFDETVDRPWIISMCRSGQRSHHPLRHILMARFLCGSLENLVQLTEHDSRNMLANLHQRRGSVTNYDEKKAEYRKRWLAACKSNPGACQNEIRKTDEAAYIWLNRHDHAWLQLHPKKRLPRGGNKTYANWKERDQQLSKQVPVVARKLLAQSGKPIRISITRLMEELGCGSMSASARQNLPLTNAELSRCSEDITTFRLRKIAWAEQELLRRAEPVARWRILKLSGIRHEDWDSMWDIYTASLATQTNPKCSAIGGNYEQ